MRGFLILVLVCQALYASGLTTGEGTRRSVVRQLLSRLLSERSPHSGLVDRHRDAGAADNDVIKRLYAKKSSKISKNNAAKRLLTALQATDAFTSANDHAEHRDTNKRLLATLDLQLGLSMQDSWHDSFWMGERIYEDWSDWMSGIPDSTKLQDMSIPGTHDSMALYGGSYVQCQSMSLAEQFKAGIRFLDIRCRYFNGVFTIHHGAYYQHAIFDDALKAAEKFLRDHPRETILMSVKQEYSSEPENRFINRFKEYLSKFPSSLFWTSNRYPTIGEVRGKIVIVNRFGGDIGLRYDNFDISDEYTVHLMFLKLTAVLEHLAKASTSSESKMFLTFCSGVGVATPAQVASKINLHVMKYAKENRGKNARLGIVVLDFPGSWVSHAIFMTNSGAQG